MISDPIQSNFRTFFMKGFIYEEVYDDIFPLFQQLDMPYESIEAYLNSTIMNTRIPGLKDEGTEKQTNRGKFRTYKGSMIPQEMVDKTLTLTFKLKGSFLNWIIFYKQTLKFLDSSAGSDRVFLPPIYTHILDDNGNAIIELQYNQIRITDLPDLDLKKSDNGIVSREFDITFAWNNFDIKSIMKRINYTKPEFKHK